MNQYDLVDIAISKSIGSYSRKGSQYSATDLLHSPRLTLLRRRYEEHRPSSTKENSFSAFKGNGIHNEMRKGMYGWKKEMEVVDPDFASGIYIEYRLMDKILDRRIGGTPDLVIGDTLYDYKTKKAWSKKYMENSMPHWEQQLNIYAYLLRDYDVHVNNAFIVTFYLDWNSFSAEKSPLAYPQEEVEYVPVTVWTYEQQHDFIYDRVERLIKAESLDDDLLPPCESDDTWSRTSYRVCRKGGKRAVKIYSTSGQAYAHVNRMKVPSDYFVIPTTTDPMFCKEFCWTNKFCSQWKEWCAENGEKKT